jgi:hypothetical protein
MSSFNKSPIVIEYPDWEVSQNKYMPPKINDKGGKSISVISKQTNRGLCVSTPLMITWGISDFCDDQGNSDGKYSMSLSFPNEEYKTEETEEFLTKCKAFENQILDDAVSNSEVWWGEKMSRDIVKHTFFPFLKYPNDKITKRKDCSKPPSLKAKVPCYGDKWSCQIYDTELNLLFPVENNPSSTPMDFIPKASSVVCGLQCTGIWIGGKGWGLTWKLIQCIVKPKVVMSVYDKCHLKLSVKDKDNIQSQVVKADEPEPQDNLIESLVEEVVTSTIVEDSDDEISPEEEEVKQEEPAVAAIEPVVAQTSVKKVIKKVVSSATTASVAPTTKEESPVVTPTIVKKVVKKKVVS